MRQISTTLVRTVFLPAGSPPIGSIDHIQADLSNKDINSLVSAKNNCVCISEGKVFMFIYSLGKSEAQYNFRITMKQQECVSVVKKLYLSLGFN